MNLIHGALLTMNRLWAKRNAVSVLRTRVAERRKLNQSRMSNRANVLPAQFKKTLCSMRSSRRNVSE